MTARDPQPSVDNTGLIDGDPKPSVDSTALLLGVVTIVSGVAVGLLSDLQDPGKYVGGAAFAAWVIAISVLLIKGNATVKDKGKVTWASVVMAVALVLTAGLLTYAFFTGPRVNARTLLLTPAGVQAVNAACPEAVDDDDKVAADVALNQLDDQFIHIELKAECDAANRDLRLRTGDLRAVLPK